MAIQYAIEDGALVLRMAAEGFDSLLGALNAAIQEPRARPNMPLLIDVRAASAGRHTEDVRARMQILPQMQEQLGPRWAVVVGKEPLPAGVARMFAFFTRVEGLEVGMFTGKDEALRWLKQPTGRAGTSRGSAGTGRPGELGMDILLERLRSRWQAVRDDPNTTPGNRRHAEWKLENLRRSEQGLPPLPVPEELRDPDGPHFSSTLYLIEHPPDQLE